MLNLHHNQYIYRNNTLLVTKLPKPLGQLQTRRGMKQGSESVVKMLSNSNKLDFWTFSGFSSFLSIQAVFSVLAWIFLLVIYRYMKKPSIILEQLGFIGFIFYTEIFSFLVVLRSFRLDLVNLLIYELKIEYLLGYWVTFFVSYLLFYPIKIVFSFLGSYVFNKLRDLYQYFLIKLKS